MTKAWVAGFASLRPVKFLLYDVTIVLASPFLTSCLQRQTNRSSLLVHLSWNWSCKYTVQILVQLVVQSTIKGELHLNAIFPPLDLALMEISCSCFKELKNPIIIL